MAEPNIEDLYTMSLDDLKRKALEESSGQQQEPVAAKDTPRDTQGRFAKAQEDELAEEEQPEGEEEEAPAKILYRRVVDIGDGVDPEIFEANSLEELLDKIADAKGHATKKIRQQEAELRKQKEAEAPKPRQFSEDEEYVYSQELMAKPTQAFAKMFKDMTGMEITQFKTVAEKTMALDSAKNTNEAIIHFVTTHPTYVDDKRSADLMTLALGGRDKTAENLEKAYQNLVAKGLLAPGKDEQGSVQDEQEPAKTGITSEASVKSPSQGTRKASGLSGKNRAPVATQNNEPSEDEARRMPLDQLRELANKQLAGR
jgi:hypothetical protein